MARLMSPHVKERIFEPFFTTKTREQGTGLGLAIVHGIIKEHGGGIEIQSAPGKGTTFTITVPIVEIEDTTPAREQSACKTHASGELVLVAEDNWNVRSILSAALIRCGFQVLEAADGASLMDHFTEHLDEVRLLVLNVDLPGRSGLDCLADIRDRGVSTPAIFVTGRADTPVESDLDRNTVLLRKPFEMSELQQLATDLISARGSLETKT